MAPSPYMRRIFGIATSHCQWPCCLLRLAPRRLSHQDNLVLKTMFNDGATKAPVPSKACQTRAWYAYRESATSVTNSLASALLAVRSVRPFLSDIV